MRTSTPVALPLSRLAYDMESVLSPMISAVLLLVINFHGLFVGTAVGFVLSALLVLRSGLSTERTDVPSTPFWSRATRGVVMFVTRPALRALLALDLTVAAGTALVLVNTVVVMRRDLGLRESSVATALGFEGAGSMIVALSVPAILRRCTDRPVILTGAALTPVALVLAAVAVRSSRSPLVLVAWLLIGASISFMPTPSGRVVNRSVTAAERPAAFAASFSMSHAFFLIAYPVAGRAGARLSDGVSASRTAISQHLAKLRLAGLVDVERSGRHQIYRHRGGTWSAWSGRPSTRPTTWRPAKPPTRESTRVNGAALSVMEPSE